MNRLNLTLLLSTGLLTTAFFTSESRLDPIGEHSEKALNGPIESISIDRLSNRTIFDNTSANLPALDIINNSYDAQKSDEPFSDARSIITGL